MVVLPESSVGRTGVEPAPLGLKARCTPLCYRPVAGTVASFEFLESHLHFSWCTRVELNHPARRPQIYSLLLAPANYSECMFFSKILRLISLAMATFFQSSQAWNWR